MRYLCQQLLSKVSKKESYTMNHPILPGMIYTYVRQHQHELEQRAQLNELLHQAAEARATNAANRISLVAAPMRGLIRLVAGITSLAGRSSPGSDARQELEAKA
jgi:hypothetical protein